MNKDIINPVAMVEEINELYNILNQVGVQETKFANVRHLLNRILRANASTSEIPKVGGFYRHKKRYSGYIVYFASGVLQTTNPLEDGTKLITYIGEDGQVWHRSPDEFNDGRFEKLD